MCGRFTLTSSVETLLSHFQIDAALSAVPSYNIAPSQRVLTVRQDATSGRRSFAWQRWGLIPGWAKDPAIGQKLINARSETVTEKPAFRSAFSKRRCLVVADGFFEWVASANRQQGKRPHYIRMKNGQPFGFAGLWESWNDREKNSLIESCTILTGTPNQLIAPLHKRMPIIIPPQDYADWLASDSPPDLLTGLLRPYQAAQMTAFEVSRRVNSPAYNDPTCIVPLRADA